MQYFYSERVTASEGCAAADEINRVLERFPESTLFAVQPDSRKRNFSWILVTMDRKHYDKVIAKEAKDREQAEKEKAQAAAAEAEARRLAEIERLKAGIEDLTPKSQPEEKKAQAAAF